MSDKRAVLVIGAGDTTGGAIARRFAREGFVACVTDAIAENYWQIHCQPRTA